MNFGSRNPFADLPLVVKNLLILNVLMLLATFASSSAGIDLAQILGLHHWSSDLFRPHQLITYMFMHGGISGLIAASPFITRSCPLLPITTLAA